ncbi:unnamed protein product [Lathyrus oleraceus]
MKEYNILKKLRAEEQSSSSTDKSKTSLLFFKTTLSYLLLKTHIKTNKNHQQNSSSHLPNNKVKIDHESKSNSMRGIPRDKITSDVVVVGWWCDARAAIHEGGRRCFCRLLAVELLRLPTMT